MIVLLRRHYQGRALRAVRRLHDLYIDYPTDTLRAAVRRAVDHNQYDLVAVERIVLQTVGAELFRLPPSEEEP